MAYLFLTNKERELYQSVPQKIEEDILWKNFFLSKEDKIFIHFFHGNQSKVAVALQVGIIRLLGFLPEGWNSQINPDWIGFIMEQLKIAVNPNLLDYGNRPATKTEHLQQILKHLDYRRWQPIMDEPVNEKWLLLSEEWNTIMSVGYWKNFVRNCIVRKYYVLPLALWKG